MVEAADNPLRSSKILSYRYQFSELQWQELILKLEAEDYRGAIIGPKGSGKTTLLEDLSKRLINQKIYFYSTEGLTKPDWQSIFLTREHTLIIIDGFAELSWFLRQLIYWQTKMCRRGLLVSLHQRNQLPVLVETENSYQIFTGILRHFLSEVELSLVIEQTAKIYREEKGNVRTSLQRVYRLLSEQDRPYSFSNFVEVK